ncbi:MAG: molybdenum cofactor biosynthesis protein B [Pseudomonadota bacterium]
MAGIDETRPFVPVRIAVLVVSDTRTLETDTSGATLVDRLETAGHTLAVRDILKDDASAVRTKVETWIGDPEIDVVITSGGTGLTGRDITYEAVTPLFDKTIEGFSVIFHQVSYGTVGLSTLQSRATAGLAAGTIIFCLPGSTGAARDGWDEIIRYQLDSRYRPCNLVELMPRFMER